MQEDGKTFCLECQTELESAKEIVYDTVDFGLETGDLTQRSRVLTTTVKKQAVQAVELPTSWECFNQILCNLVDEIEEIEENLFGTINRDFKLTVLQLWAAYLRYHNKAFFSKESADYPRFNSQYNMLDAEIIYKIKRPRKIYPKKKRKALTTNARARKRNIRTIQKRANQLELSKKNPTVTVEPVKPSIPFQFTSKAKECLKKLMSDEHLQEHETNPTLKCHSVRYRDTRKKTEEITRTKLYVLIFMGLNHVKSDIQLGDLVRFLREGHLSLQIASSISSDARYNLEFNNRIQRGCNNVPMHASLRAIAFDLAEEIGFQFKAIDLSRLCQRYVQELCLPPFIANLIDVILHACPPTMGEGRSVKNYEGRAMAYILFVLKLLFGLDDSREYSISSSGRELNKRIAELNTNCDVDTFHQRPVFIWCDWVDYIEMRNIILTQLHCPTAMKSYAHGDGMTTMYLEYLTKTDERNADAKSTFKPYAKLLQRVRDQFQLTYSIDPKWKEKLTFCPSITPKRSYMEEVRYSDQCDVIIPTFMDAAHDERDIEPFLNPSKLQSFFRTHHIKLEVNKLKCNADIGVPDPTSNLADLDLHDHRFGTYCCYDFDITTEKWLKAMNDRKENEANLMPKDEAKATVEMRLESIDAYNRSSKEKKTAHLRNDAADEANETSMDSAQTESTDAHIFDCFSADDDINDDVELKETLNFSISNSDHWLQFNSIHANKKEFTDFRKTFSKTFQWLLKQGAELIENQECDLYFELMVIEYYFTKDVKPSNDLSKNLLKRFKTICRSTVCNNY
ncbi:hypothetical protein HA402_003343 [Bradysia odoriphaga]|nr:hypothetical protein HA402_003343 [Bradysia odoriphaga]